MTEHPGEKLSAYIDGELDEAEARGVEEHLTACAACRKEADRIRALSEAAREHEPFDEVTTRRFLAENRARRSRAARALPAPTDALTMLIALAAICIISIGVFVALGGPLRNMFAGAVGTGTMGQNQAALSGGIY